MNGQMLSYKYTKNIQNLLLNVERCLFLPQHFYFRITFLLHHLFIMSVNRNLLKKSILVYLLFHIVVNNEFDTIRIVRSSWENDFSRAFCLFSYTQSHFDIPAVLTAIVWQILSIEVDCLLIAFTRSARIHYELQFTKSVSAHSARVNICWRPSFPKMMPGWKVLAQIFDPVSNCENEDVSGDNAKGSPWKSFG